jgi:hypothetical protein
MRKFSVDASVMVSPSFLSCRCVPRNPNAVPVAPTVRLRFNHGWFPDKQFAAHLYPANGREMLDVLAGWRTGFLATLSN